MLSSSNKIFTLHDYKFTHHFLTSNYKRPTFIFAKKRDFPQNSETKNQKPIFESKISSKFLAQSAIAVLGLGFVDAGYSGDWSRIGAISTETEDLLKASAFVVVRLCLFLIFSSPKSQRTEVTILENWFVVHPLIQIEVALFVLEMAFLDISCIDVRLWLIN